jgi:hypothetical protein
VCFHFANQLSRESEFAANRRQAAHPKLSSFLWKNPLAPSGKSHLEARASQARQEGRFAIVTNVGHGMRWTRGAARRAVRSRTAKSCGLDASTLASSRRSDLPAMVARKPDHQREHEASR